MTKIENKEVERLIKSILEYIFSSLSQRTLGAIQITKF